MKGTVSGSQQWWIDHVKVIFVSYLRIVLTSGSFYFYFFKGVRLLYYEGQDRTDSQFEVLTNYIEGCYCNLEWVHSRPVLQTNSRDARFSPLDQTNNTTFAQIWWYNAFYTPLEDFKMQPSQSSQFRGTFNLQPRDHHSPSNPFPAPLLFVQERIVMLDVSQNLSFSS